MIENRLITYATAPSRLLSFEFSSVTLTALVIAALTTLLSYQATALLYDLFLGLKPRHIAKVRNLHVLLLSRQSSLLAVFDSVLRDDRLTRLRFRLPAKSFILRDDQKIAPSVSFKLLFLLLVAPVFNILSIALTLETHETLTFAQAGFGGMALDFNPDLSVIDTAPFTEDCRLAKLADTSGIVAVAQFSLCQWFSAWQDGLPEDSPYAIVDVSVIRESAFSVYVGVNECRVSTSSRATIETLDGAVVVRPGKNIQAQKRLAVEGMALLAKECGLEDTSTAEELEPYKKEGIERHVAFRILCPGASDPLESAIRVNRVIGKNSTLVNADSFAVINASVTQLDEGNPFYDAGREKFITRRNRFVSLPLLAITTMVLVVVRVIVKALCHDDLRDGLEKLVKDRLGVGKNRSLMREGRRKIFYSSGRCAGKEPFEVVETILVPSGRNLGLVQ